MTWLLYQEASSTTRQLTQDELIIHWCTHADNLDSDAIRMVLLIHV